MNKKKVIATTLNSLRILDLTLKVKSNYLIVLNFHRIKASQEYIPTFAEDVFGMTIDEFEALLLWVMSNFQVISENELINLISSNCALEENYVLITFDDGYIDNYTLAYPLLKKHGLPAIFFIPYNIIETRNLGWWDIISYLIKNCQTDSLKFEDVQIAVEGDKPRIIKHLYKKFKETNNLDKKRELMILSKLTDVDLPSIDIQSKEIMNWDQILEVQNHNISVGSHTMNHDVLSTISIEEQRNEIIQSKELLEKKIGKQVYSIAYPVGNFTHFSEETKNIAKNADYKFAFSFYSGTNKLSSLDNYDIKRLPPSGSLPLLKFEILIS